MYIVSPSPQQDADKNHRFVPKKCQGFVAFPGQILKVSEKPHILSVSEKPPLSTWGACKNRSQPQLKVSFKFVVPPDDKNCKWDEFWKDVSLRIDLRASKGVGIPKEKNLYDWMKLTKTPRRRISAFAVVLVNQQANARTMLWTESLNFFFAQKCRWTWVTLSPGFSESGSQCVASACVRTSHVLHMYCTCQRIALGWGPGGCDGLIQIFSD